MAWFPARYLDAGSSGTLLQPLCREVAGRERLAAVCTKEEMVSDLRSWVSCSNPNFALCVFELKVDATLGDGV